MSTFTFHGREFVVMSRKPGHIAVLYGGIELPSTADPEIFRLGRKTLNMRVSEVVLIERD